MKRSQPLGRGKPLARGKPLGRGSSSLGRGKRINPVSEKRREENIERRRVLLETYGPVPDCTLCKPLRDAGIVTGCNGRADDGDEILRRSRGGSIVDPANVRPVGRRCHTWVTEHPAEAAALGLTKSRYGFDEGGE